MTNQATAGKRKRWQFMTRFDINDDKGNLYLRRWRVIQTPLCSLYLHKIVRGDSDPFVHDHPWVFLSIILRGGYVEVRRDNFTHQLRERHVRWWNYMSRDDAHYIKTLDRNPTWTLLFVGRRRRTWGFWVPSREHINGEVPNQSWVEFDNWTGR